MVGCLSSIQQPGVHTVAHAHDKRVQLRVVFYHCKLKPTPCFMHAFVAVFVRCLSPIQQRGGHMVAHAHDKRVARRYNNNLLLLLLLL